MGKVAAVGTKSTSAPELDAEYPHPPSLHIRSWSSNRAERSSKFMPTESLTASLPFLSDAKTEKLAPEPLHASFLNSRNKFCV
jgi:hypothetical protein